MKSPLCMLSAGFACWVYTSIALAQDPKPVPTDPIATFGSRPSASLAVARVGTSPFDPPEASDTRFVVDQDVGLDTGCVYRGSGPLLFTIPISRVVGDVTTAKANGLISETAILTMPGYDVDYGATPITGFAERDLVTINGHVVPAEFLLGVNDEWRLNAYEIPIEWLNFATAPVDPNADVCVSPEPGLNTIQIDIDTLNADELWCTEVDWATVEFEATPPLVMVHGILSSGPDTWGPDSGAVWKPSVDALSLIASNRLSMGRLDSIQRNAAKIASEVERVKQCFGVQRVNVAAHSKGGIDSRHYLENSNSVVTLLQIGTPNAGSPVADLVQKVLLKGLGVGWTVVVNLAVALTEGPAGLQLTTPYMALYNAIHWQHDAQVNYAAIAGVYDPECAWFDPTCRPVERLLLAVTGEGDTIVPKDSVFSLSYTTNYEFHSSGADEDAIHTSQTKSRRLFNDRAKPIIVARVGDRKDPAQASPQSVVSYAATGTPWAETSPLVAQLGEGESRELELPIDPADSATISLLYPSGDVSMTLTTPSGAHITPLSSVAGSGISFDSADILGGKMASYLIATPEPGIWRVTLSAVALPGGSATVDCGVTASLQGARIDFAGAALTKQVHAGEPIDLQGILTENGAPRTGAAVSAVVAFPDNVAANVTLVDDGTGTDPVANDGIYNARVSDTSRAGYLRIGFTAESVQGTVGTEFSRSDFDVVTVAASTSNFTGVFTDAGTDSNGNGLFDALTVQAEVNITREAEYGVFATLLDSQGNTHSAQTVLELPVGSSTVSLAFPGAGIYRNMVDGPYTLASAILTETDPWGELRVQELTNAHTTSAYAYGAFEHSRMYLTGNGVAAGVDTNGNGLFDQLTVELEVQADVSGAHSWSAQLSDQYRTQIGFTNGSATFQAGRNRVVLTFDGNPIGRNGVDSPFVVSTFVLHGTSGAVTAIDVFAAEGFSANQFEQCGVCAEDSDCNDHNPCTDDSCGTDLHCVFAPNTGACDDHDACTAGDVCAGGICRGITTVACPASGQCYEVRTCNPLDGTCSEPRTKANNTPCDDQRTCTGIDTCQEGVCVGVVVVGGQPCDDCHDLGTCDPVTGICAQIAKPDGTVCDDKNPCTLADSCRAGSCRGSSVITCDPPDQCHDQGVCDSWTGACVPPAKPDGTTCDDGDACTLDDRCEVGICIGLSPVVCDAEDQCHDVGICDAQTGSCPSPAKPDGTSCDDGDACTQADTCVSGSCRGSAPVDCPAPSQCHDPGSCDSITGACSEVPKADGESCDDGDGCTEADVCVSGTCVAGSLVTCTAQDECHESGTCDPITGMCSNPPKPEGTPCTGGACVGETCQPAPTTDGGTEPSGQDDPATDAGGSGGAAPEGANGIASQSQPGATDAGCGCRTGGKGKGTWFSLLGFILLFAARRRRAPA